ncbi:MAG: hypothetical protein RIT10_2099 [Bacteroidota bacterium]|jgi:hypothetical protein
MIKALQIALIFMLLLACNKEQTLLEELNGAWKINGVTLTDSEGIRYEGTTTVGQLNFDSNSKTYTFNLNYSTSFVSNNYNFNGTFTLSSDNRTVQLNYLKPSNELYSFEFKLIYASKDYLKIEYWDESYRLNTLLFSR